MNADALMTALWQHIDLTLAALLTACAIALPTGFLVARSKRLSRLVLLALGAIYTIPSLALFACLIPLTGLGADSALIGLVIYAQFILIRNVVLGFQGVDPDLLEAARGMGLHGWRLFCEIELPLALPLIIGGIRIAAVSIAGIATVAAWINAGGLGTLIFEGIYQNHLPKLLTGTALIAAFSMGLNQFLYTFERDALANARGELTPSD